MLGVSKRVHADHIVRQPDKMSMLTSTKEGNPTIQSDSAETSRTWTPVQIHTGTIHAVN